MKLKKELFICCMFLALSAYINGAHLAQLLDDSLLLLNEITRSCDGPPRSVAEYVSEFGVPLEYLGSVGILRFDNKNLDSLDGIQDLSYSDVAIVTFANNCIVGSDLDPQFPSNPFQGLPNLAWLFLGENDISTVPATFFSDTPKISLINLSNNGFTSIPSGLFNNLGDLAYLDLSNNLALATLSSTVFADMASLQYLHLNNNAIASIPSSLFANNTELRSIDLSNNLLLTWPSAVLDDLQDLLLLDLSNNLLISFSPNSLPDGSTVILTGNALTVLQKNTLQSNFPEVNFVF